MRISLRVFAFAFPRSEWVCGSPEAVLALQSITEVYHAVTMKAGCSANERHAQFRDDADGEGVRWEVL